MKKAIKKGSVVCDIAEKFVFVVSTKYSQFYIYTLPEVHITPWQKQEPPSFTFVEEHIMPGTLVLQTFYLLQHCSSIWEQESWYASWMNIEDTVADNAVRSRCVCVCVSHMRNEIWHLFRHAVFFQAFIPRSVEVLQLNSFRHCTGIGVHHVPKFFKALFKIIILKCYSHNLLLLLALCASV